VVLEPAPLDAGIDVVDEGGTDMRTTVAIDDDLLAQAQEATGIDEPATLIRAGLKSLVEREAARRLILMGGTMPDLDDIPRRRPEPSEGE